MFRLLRAASCGKVVHGRDGWEVRAFLARLFVQVFGGRATFCLLPCLNTSPRIRDSGQASFRSLWFQLDKASSRKPSFFSYCISNALAQLLLKVILSPKWHNLGWHIPIPFSLHGDKNGRRESHRRFLQQLKMGDNDVLHPSENSKGGEGHSDLWMYRWQSQHNFLWCGHGV